MPAVVCPALRKTQRVATEAGLNVVGCIGVPEAGARQGIRFDLRLLQESLARLGLPRL